MPLINWSDKYSVGNPNIDEQHQELIQIINKLDDAIKDNKSRETLDNIITDMYFYSASHFGYEEAMMERTGYSQLENHKGIHRYFMRTINNLQDEFEHGNTTISAKILLFLKEWIEVHIREVDREYSVVV